MMQSALGAAPLFAAAIAWNFCGALPAGAVAKRDYLS
jgi:hypothetical protein